MALKFTSLDVVVISAVLMVCLTVLVVLGKLPSSAIAAPAGWFFGWLMKSPLAVQEKNQ